MSVHHFEDTATVENLGPSSIVLIVEPWTSEYIVPAGATYVVRAASTVSGKLELDRQPGCVTCWAWPGSVAEVRSGERLIDSLETVVPDVPPGQSVRGFIRSLFDRDETG